MRWEVYREESCRRMIWLVILNDISKLREMRIGLNIRFGIMDGIGCLEVVFGES